MRPPIDLWYDVSVYITKPIMPEPTDTHRGGLSSSTYCLDWRRYKLKVLVNGWVNYFKLADTKTLLKEIDEWCRRRIRMVYWKQWKKTRTKLKALVKLGIPKNKAWEWANSRKAYWRIAGSWVLTRTLGNARLKGLGWVTFSDRYELVRC